MRIPILALSIATSIASFWARCSPLGDPFYSKDGLDIGGADGLLITLADRG